MFTIGKLAAQAQLSIDAIRNYEKAGLLFPAGKTGAGYRVYDASAVCRIRFIKQAQQCSFSLSEIHELLALRKGDGACRNDVRSIAIAKKWALADKINAMQAMLRALADLIQSCDDDVRPIDKCPILTSLETNSCRQHSTS